MADALSTLKNDAREAAEQLHREHGLSVPVDPIGLARRLGIRVVEAELAANVSGLIRKRAGEDPMIAIAKGEPATRRRFTCAHELGHWLRRVGASEFSFVDLRSNEGAGGKPDEEVFADEFAGNLLMPEAELVGAREKIDRDRLTNLDVANLARRFGVSDFAMRVRLSKLGLLSR